MTAPVKISVEMEGDQQAVARLNRLAGAVDSLPDSALDAKSEWQKLLDEVERSRKVSDVAAESTNALAGSVGGLSAKSGLLTTALSVLSGPAGMMGVVAATSILMPIISSWINETDDAAESTSMFTDALAKQREELHKLRTEYSLIGFKGAAREEEVARRGLERTQAALQQMRVLLAQQEAQRLTPSQRAALGGIDPFGISCVEICRRHKIEKDIEQTKGTIANLQAQEENWRMQLAIGMRRLVDEHADAEEERTAKSKKEYEARLKELQAYLDQTRKLEIAAITDPALRIGTQRLEDLEAAGMGGAGITPEAVAARRAAINAKAVVDLQNIWLQQTKKQKTGDVLDDTTSTFLGGLKAEEKSLQEYVKRGKEALQIWEREQDRIIDLNEKMARDAETKFERTADAIEGFFNRVFLTARSFSDVWRQLWGQIANYAVNQVAKIVAAWWTGQKSMTQASVTGGYGGMGGGGASQGVQSVLQFASAVPMASTASGGGMSEGLSDYYSYLTGGGSGVVGNTGGGSIQGGSSLGGSIGNLLTSPSGSAMLGGIGLSVMGAGINRGNMWLAGLGGFLGGGFTGMAVGSTLLAGTAMGAWAGPIGAAIGLGVGLFMAARKRNQQKKQSTAVHASYNEIQARIIAEYEAHKRGYDDSVSTLTSAYDSSVVSLQSMGGPGRRTINEITAYYKEGMSRLKAIQARREGRLGSIAGLPLPEFHSGSPGIIQTGGSQPFLAMLKPKEAVLNERAAAALGDEAIKKLNRGQSAGGTTIINISATDTKTLRQWLQGERDVFVEFIRRQAKDQGMPIPL